MICLNYFGIWSNYNRDANILKTEEVNFDEHPLHFFFFFFKKIFKLSKFLLASNLKYRMECLKIVTDGSYLCQATQNPLEYSLTTRETMYSNDNRIGKEESSRPVNSFLWNFSENFIVTSILVEGKHRCYCLFLLHWVKRLNKKTRAGEFFALLLWKDWCDDLKWCRE